jgi:preprotein translocase subunit SecD
VARSSVTRAGRTLVAFFSVLAVLYGLVALAGSWTPELGLDLQGGTRITLIAKDGANTTPENLEEARRILEQRVNGSGVTEAEVSTQGNRFIVVEVPGQSRRDLVETVKRQAQLRFRVVAQSANGTAIPSSTADPSDGSSAEPSDIPSEPVVTIAPSESASPGEPKETKTPKSSSSPKNRAPFTADQEQATDGATESPSFDATSLPGEQSTESPGAGNGSEGATDGATDEPTETPTETPTDGASGAPSIDDPLNWVLNPDEESLAAFNAFSCPPPGQAPEVDDDPDKPLVTCDENGTKYLLSVAMVEGTQLTDAGLRPPTQTSVEYAVQLQFNDEGSDEFGRISDALYGTQRQFAIVLDGEVISAPTMNAPIHNGSAEITGQFTEAEARDLANSLKFGALPIQFESDPPVETVGPSLAGNQLSAGILAGLIGLGAVMLYCLVYYRGLGLVVLASLMVAAAMTYALVLLLDKAANFTLTLPGIAGLIVAVGITADSFIVYFERIRDEMRDGKSMRVAVETGWARARNTCLAADAVSLLAAVVLYIFAAGVVKGFAFALGISTLIDLAVFFWFTHPMLTFLARFKFFNSGHRLSGLSAETLGVDRLPSNRDGRSGSDRDLVGGRA